jgi:hypothetical protein
MMKSRRMRWEGYVARIEGRNRDESGVLVGKPEGKAPPGTRRSRWDNNIKSDVIEIMWGSRDCINLAEDKDHWRDLAKMVINLRVP